MDGKELAQLRHLWAAKNNFFRRAWAGQQAAYTYVASQQTQPWLGTGQVYVLKDMYIDASVTLPGGVYILEGDFIVSAGAILTFSDRPTLAAYGNISWQGTRPWAAVTTGNALRDAVQVAQFMNLEMKRFKSGGWHANTIIDYGGYGGFGGEVGAVANPSYFTGDGGAGLFTGGLSGDNLAGATVIRAQPYGTIPKGFEPVGSGADGINNGGLAGAGGGGGGGGGGGLTSQGAAPAPITSGLGGSLVLIICRNFWNGGTIRANGEDGLAGVPWGGGGGGFLGVASEKFSNASGTINLNGGNGGVSGGASGGGGGGGILALVSLGADYNPSTQFFVGGTAHPEIGTVTATKGTGGVNGLAGAVTGTSLFHEGFGMLSADGAKQATIFTGRTNKGGGVNISSGLSHHVPYFPGTGLVGTPIRPNTIQTILDFIYRFI